MLIVCPNCATSYMIDPTSVGPAGRAVRCARCKTTWFAGAPEAAAATPLKSAPTSPTPDISTPNVSAFVDGVIAEAEAQSQAPSQAPTQNSSQAPSNESSDFDGGPADDFPPASGLDSTPAPLDEAGRNTGIVPGADEGRDADSAITITDGPSLVPPMDYDGPADGQKTEPWPEHGAEISAEQDRDDGESYAVRRQRLKERRQKARRSSRWTAIVLVLFACNVALLGARNDVVRYLPQTASLFAAIGLPVNLRHLEFDKVKIVKEVQDGVSVLIVEGRIENTADKPTEVPRLRFAARNATGQEVYTWTALPERSILGPNEGIAFHTRLAAPPADATDVMVRFFNAKDAAAAGGK